MTGLELLEGLSFVDERFIAEADTAVLGRKVPWMKVLSVAACLCILLVGAFALENMGVKEEAAAPAAAAPEAMQEAAPLMPEEECVTEAVEETPIPPYAVDKEIPSGELQHVPHATLRIVKVLDDGSFDAFVEAVTREPTPLELEMQVQMVIDPDKVPGGEYVDVEYEKTVEEGMVVEIRDGAFDAGSNTLYVEGVTAAE